MVATSERFRGAQGGEVSSHTVITVRNRMLTESVSVCMQWNAVVLHDFVQSAERD